MDNDIRATAGKKMALLEAWLAPIFGKLPHLPDNARQSIVKIVPWLALIFGVLGLFSILSAGVLLTSITSMISVSFIGRGPQPVVLFISLIVSALACILELLAYKPLTERRKRGWNFLFYGAVLTTCAGILEIVLGSSFAGNILGSLIGLWLLFEIRGLYHTNASTGAPAAHA